MTERRNEWLTCDRCGDWVDGGWTVYDRKTNSVMLVCDKCHDA